MIYLGMHYIPFLIIFFRDVQTLAQGPFVAHSEPQYSLWQEPISGPQAHLHICMQSYVHLF